jgi:hypothetical protein
MESRDAVQGMPGRIICRTGIAAITAAAEYTPDNQETHAMSSDLDKVLIKIAEAYREDMLGGSRNYLEVDIGNRAEELGYPDIKAKYRQVNALVPLKQPVVGMKVRIDGRTFVNYAQFESGVVVPDHVAREAGLPYRTFGPNESMILNFA